jgi:two-component system response regulator PilR (NtrC family)
LGHLSFQGNVRELENLLHRAVAMSGGEAITPEDLGLDGPPAVEPTDRAQIDARLEQLRAAPATLIEGALPDNLEVYLDGVERDILSRALERHRNNRTAAGASLGLSLRQMRYRMARLGVVVTGQDSD